MTETRQLRAKGIDPLPFPGNPKVTDLRFRLHRGLWIGFAAMVVATGGVFPLMPILCTGWLAFEFHRRRTRPR